MKQGKEFTPEERAKITAIGDLLIERYIEQRDALEAGDRAHAVQLQFEIKELIREKQNIGRSLQCDHQHSHKEVDVADARSAPSHWFLGPPTGAVSPSARRDRVLREDFLDALKCPLCRHLRDQLGHLWDR